VTGSPVLAARRVQSTTEGCPATGNSALAGSRLEATRDWISTATLEDGFIQAA
jgi:hypothetical protein